MSALIWVSSREAQADPTKYSQKATNMVSSSEPNQSIWRNRQAALTRIMAVMAVPVMTRIQFCTRFRA